MAEAHAKHHDYHLVDPSPWPLIGAISAFLMAAGFILWWTAHADRRHARGSLRVRRRHHRRAVHHVQLVERRDRGGQ